MCVALVGGHAEALVLDHQGDPASRRRPRARARPPSGASPPYLSALSSRLRTTRARAPSSPRTGGRSDARSSSVRTRMPSTLARQSASADSHQAAHVDRPARRRLPARLGAREHERLLDHLGQAAALVAHQRAVACGRPPARSTTPSARFSPAERITASGVRSSWVTPATNSIWRRRQPLRAPRGRHQEAAARAQQQQDAEAHRQVPAARRGDHRVERARAMRRRQAPEAGPLPLAATRAARRPHRRGA